MIPNESLRPSAVVLSLAVVSLLAFASFFVVVGISFSSSHSSKEHSEESSVTPLVVEELTRTDRSPDSLSELGKHVSFHDGKIIYQASGSSSCPPIIEKAKIYNLGEEEVVVLSPVVYPQGTMCTMDLVGFSQEIYREDGADIDPETAVHFDPEWLLGEGRHQIERPDGEPLFDSRGMTVQIDPLPLSPERP